MNKDEGQKMLLHKLQEMKTYEESCIRKGSAILQVSMK